MWVFQLSPKYVMTTTGQMPCEHHPYALSWTCQLSEPQKQSVGDNAEESNIAFTNKANRTKIITGLQKSVGSLVKYR